MRIWRGLDLAAQGRLLVTLLGCDAVVLVGLAFVLMAHRDGPLPQWTRSGVPGILVGLLVGAAIPWTSWFHRAYCQALDDGLVPRFTSVWAAYSWWLPVANLWWPFTFVRALWQFHGCGRRTGRGWRMDRMVPLAMQVFAFGAAVCWCMVANAPRTARTGFFAAALAVTAGASLVFARFAARIRGATRAQPSASQ